VGKIISRLNKKIIFVIPLLVALLAISGCFTDDNPGVTQEVKANQSFTAIVTGKVRPPTNLTPAEAATIWIAVQVPDSYDIVRTYGDTKLTFNGVTSKMLFGTPPANSFDYLGSAPTGYSWKYLYSELKYNIVLTKNVDYPATLQIKYYSKADQTEKQKTYTFRYAAKAVAPTYQAPIYLSTGEYSFPKIVRSTLFVSKVNMSQDFNDPTYKGPSYNLTIFGTVTGRNVDHIELRVEAATTGVTDKYLKRTFINKAAGYSWSWTNNSAVYFSISPSIPSGQIDGNWTLSPPIPISVFTGKSGHIFRVKSIAVANDGTAERGQDIELHWFIWDNIPPRGDFSVSVDDDGSGNYVPGSATRFQNIKIDVSGIVDDTFVFDHWESGGAVTRTETIAASSYKYAINASGYTDLPADGIVALPVTNGAHNVYVRAIDKASNKYESSKIIVYDTVAPSDGSIDIVRSITRNRLGEPMLWSSVDPGGTAASGVKWISYSENQANVGSNWQEIVDAAGHPTNPIPVDLSSSDGIKTIYAKFKDAAGNISANIVSDQIWFDETAPGTCFISTPPYGTKPAGLALITGEAKDNKTGDSGIKYVRVYLQRPDGWYWDSLHSRWDVRSNYLPAILESTGSTTPPGGYTSVKWKVTSGFPTVWTDGATYKIRAEAADCAGNTTLSSERTFKIDKTGGIITGITASPDPAKDGDTVSISFTNDDISGTPVVSVEGKATTPVDTTNPTYTYTYAVSRSNDSEGLKTISVSAQDAAGNSITGEGTVTFDFTPPTGAITIEGGAEYTSKTGTWELSLSASDNLSSTGEIKMIIWGDVTPDLSWNQFFQSTLSRGVVNTSPDGPKTVSVEYRDKAGNTSEVYSDTIFLDTNAPNVLTIETPVASTIGKVSTIIPVSGTVADRQPGSGISKVEIWIRKGLSGNYTYWNGTGWDSQIVWLQADNITPGTGGSPDTWYKSTGLPTSWQSGDTDIAIMPRATDNVGKTLQPLLPKYITVNLASLNNISLTEGINWISLPYTNSYTNARGIADSINGAKTPGTSGTCTEVGKWLTSSGNYEKLTYAFGSWTGNNFTVQKGEAYYVSIKGTPTWSVNGTHDPSFAFNLSYPNGSNIYWISLPYSSIYAKAQDIVNDMNNSNPGTVVEIGRQPPGGTTEKLTYAFGIWTGDDFAFRPGEGYYISLRKPLTNWIP